MNKLALIVVSIALLPSVDTALANHQHREDSHHSNHRYANRGGFDSGWRTWFAAGVGFGGDELGRFQDDEGEVEKVTAGKGGHFEGGLVFGMDAWSSLRLSGGFQTGGVSRINGDTSFDRFQFGITALRTHRMHEIGAGLTMHTGINYSCDINELCSGTVDFEPAVGYTLEYALRFSSYSDMRSGSKRGLRLGLRYTGIEYQPKVGTDVLNGRSLAGFIGVVF